MWYLMILLILLLLGLHRAYHWEKTHALRVRPIFPQTKFLGKIGCTLTEASEGSSIPDPKTYYVFEYGNFLLFNSFKDLNYGSSFLLLSSEQWNSKTIRESICIGKIFLVENIGYYYRNKNIIIIGNVFIAQNYLWKIFFQTRTRIEILEGDWVVFQRLEQLWGDSLNSKYPVYRSFELDL